jgi:hypothetical protein
VSFARAPWSGRTHGGVFVAAAALRHSGWREAVAAAEPAAPHLVFDWSPGGEAEELAPLVDALTAEVSGPVVTALCPHPGGPPACWCRPPLPGLPLAFAREYSIDPGRSILVGTSTANRTLATTLGARYVEMGSRPDSA